MFRFALVALTCLVSANAGCISQWTDAACTMPEANTGGCMTNNVCINSRSGSTDVSILATCASSESTSSWTYQTWFGASGCPSTSTPLLDISGSSSTACVANSGSYYKFDCGAGNGCFSATAHVTLENGDVILYSDLKVGDKVLSVAADGSSFFDKVFRITHYGPEEHFEFVQITTTTGRTVELTASHYLHVNNDLDLAKLTLANDVVIGDTIYALPAGQPQAKPETVQTVERVMRVGAFNAHTLSGSIVVNGVCASHFTTESTWSAPSRHLATYWYHAVDAVSSILGAEDASA